MTRFSKSDFMAAFMAHDPRDRKAAVRLMVKQLHYRRIVRKRPKIAKQRRIPMVQSDVPVTIDPQTAKEIIIPFPSIENQKPDEIIVFLTRRGTGTDGVPVVTDRMPAIQRTEGTVSEVSGVEPASFERRVHTFPENAATVSVPVTAEEQHQTRPQQSHEKLSLTEEEQQEQELDELSDPTPHPVPHSPHQNQNKDWFKPLRWLKALKKYFSQTRWDE